MTLTVLRLNGQAFCRLSLHWDWFDIFLMVWLSLALGVENYRGEVCFHDIISSIHTVNITDHCHVNLDHVRLHWSVFSTAKLFFSPVFPAVLFGRKSLYVATLKGQRVVLYLLEAKYLDKLYAILLHKRRVYCLYLFIYIIMDTWIFLQFGS